MKNRHPYRGPIAKPVVSALALAKAARRPKDAPPTTIIVEIPAPRLPGLPQPAKPQESKMADMTQAEAIKPPKHNNPNPKFKKLTTLEMLAMCDLIRKVCKLGDDGFAVYDEGWSDKRVADEALPDYSGNGATTVGVYRTQIVGKIRKVSKAAPVPANGDIEALRAEVKTLRRLVKALCRDIAGDTMEYDRELIVRCAEEADNA